MIKSAFKGLLQRAGLHLFTNGSLPCGANWLLDVEKLGLSASPTFFDVGANVGQTVFEVRAAYPQARIFAFEPFPATFETLQERTAQLKNVQLFPLALGANRATLHVNVREDSVLNSLAGGSSQSSGSEKTDSNSTVAIAVDSLDRFCAQQPDVGIIDVLKTDTEGYDLQVLQGAEGLLEAGRVRYVYVEVTFYAQNRQNTAFSPVFDLLAARNFRFLGLYETFSLHHFAEPNVFCNALFVHRSNYQVKN